VLVPAQREWLEKLLIFQRAIQPRSASTLDQPGVHLPTMESHFHKHSRKLWRLYRLPMLRYLEYLKELQDFLHFLESDPQDTYSPFRKQVANTVKCADHLIAYFAQRKPWCWRNNRGRTECWGCAGIIFLVIALGSLFFYGVSNNSLPALITFGAVVLFVIPLGVILAINACYVNPKLTYALSCRKRQSHEEQGRNQAPLIILTVDQATRSLIRELELLRVGILKRRVPLRVALLEERRGDWGQFEAEYEQENYGYASTYSIYDNVA
jgi:hypothetical protein